MHYFRKSAECKGFLKPKNARAWFYITLQTLVKKAVLLPWLAKKIAQQRHNSRIFSHTYWIIGFHIFPVVYLTKFRYVICDLYCVL